MGVLLCVLVFCLGVLSMGLQLLASRVLAPFFWKLDLCLGKLNHDFLSCVYMGLLLGLLQVVGGWEHRANS